MTIIELPKGAFNANFLCPERWESVAKSAQHLGVSMRRVRLLLAQGRLLGRRREVDAGARRVVWEVAWPLVIRKGTRGPCLGYRETSSQKEQKPRRLKGGAEKSSR